MPEQMSRALARTRDEAQRRTDQILAFRRELASLEQTGIVALDPEAAMRLAEHHDRELQALAGRFDVDRSEGQRSLSLGLRAASLVGAVALSAAVFFFFYRIWGHLGVGAQLGILIAVPLACTAGVEIAARRERTLYVASLLALVAAVSFGLNLGLVIDLFNLTPAPWPFAAWAAFTLALAYPYRLRLLAAGGLVGALFFVCAQTATIAGVDWTSAMLRPEPVLVGGGLILALASVSPNRVRDGFPATFRLVGALAMFLAILVVSSWGEFSYLPASADSVEAVYSIAGFLLPSLGIWMGLRRRLGDLVHTSSTCLVVFIYAKCFDWAWDWLPGYLFFLLLAAIAVVVLVLLRRLRDRMRQV